MHDHPRVVGIVRVSERKGREGDAFVSPAEQRDRISGFCDREGMDLVGVYEEIDVSGGLTLDRRDGLRPAVDDVEHGRAEVVVVAYFDRLFRSLAVQGEVVSRVEAAGGRVLALDFGEVTEATAAQWLSGTMIGAVSEYYRRSVRERSGAAQARAVARGVVPYAQLPPGLVRGNDGTCVPDPELAPIAVEAFELRDQGATIKGVRTFLASHGIGRSYHGVQSMLRSPLYVGEIHFGRLVNLDAHDPIIDRDLWKRVQRRSDPRGRRAKSDRLLARLGVLRCATCDGRMVVGVQTQGGRRYPLYRCSPVGDCPRRVTISAQLVEEEIVARVREHLADAEGRASAEQHAREAEQAAERAQADLDAALRAFEGLHEEPAARERLAALAETRNEAVARLHQLGRTGRALTINADTDWDMLSLDARRALIRATVDRATVAPGRGRGRLTIHLLSQ